MKMKLFLFVVLCVATTITSYSQNVTLTKNLSYDSKQILQNYEDKFVKQAPLESGNRKSGLLAGVLSAVIPGAGEIYTGEYIKAGIFLAVEAAAISIGLTYDKKGNDRTTEFKKYADEKWSVVRYAQYLINYQGAPSDIIKSNDESKKPWERVDWDKLNQAEVGSHHLERYGEQQYYEMIGKYFEFAAGWDDFTGTNLEARSPNDQSYMSLRHNANEAYNTAAKAVIFIYVNHVLSIIDAVWSASNYNKNLNVSAICVPHNYGYATEYVPTLNFKYSF